MACHSVDSTRTLDAETLRLLCAGVSDLSQALILESGASLADLECAVSRLHGARESPAAARLRLTRKAGLIYALLFGQPDGVA
jgi:hypothetical protein